MSRIIDLTLPLQDGQRGVSIERARQIETDGWNATTLHLYSHCGTHMDAPQHFGVTNQTIDQIPLEQCMGPAWVVDLTGIEPRALIQVGDLGPVRDNLRAGDGLLQNVVRIRFQRSCLSKTGRLNRVGSAQEALHPAVLRVL